MLFIPFMNIAVKFVGPKNHSTRSAFLGVFKKKEVLVVYLKK